jgi:1-acyl-sn-glycerol-3-phosphate acyltransferase
VELRQAFRLALVFCIVSVYFAAAPFGYGAFALLHCFRARDRRERARLLQAIMRRAFTLMHDTLRVCGLLDFNPRDIDGELPPGPAVLVANHPTLCDVTSTMAAFADVTTAVKPGLFRRRWFRPLLHDARFFEGAGGPFDSGAVVEAGVERIREGFRVLIFPEGTRSPRGALHRFGRAAFEIACKADVPVIPIVIQCEPVWLSKEQGVFAPPPQRSRMRLIPLEPVYPRDCQCSSRKLRDVVEARLRRAVAVPTAPSQGLTNGTDGTSIARASAQEPHRSVPHAGGRQAGGH